MHATKTEDWKVIVIVTLPVTSMNHVTVYISQFSITAMWNHAPYTTCGIIGFSTHKEP